MRIRTFILSASAVVAVGFFGAGYFTVSRILDHAVRENARAAAEVLAQTAFTGMYQVMSTGWSRKQAEAYIAAMQNAAGNSGPGISLQIYRSPASAADFGEIAQPALDDRLRAVITQGRTLTESPAGGIRHLMPLLADAHCLRCHVSAQVGNVLGIVEVKQDFTPLLASARNDFLRWMLIAAPLLMALAGLVVWRVNRRLEQAIDIVNSSVAEISAVADLRHVEFAGRNFGFEELNRLFGHLGQLVEKLRAVAVDKDVLRFEIGLLEKFVITSDVVRDWGEYIARLLAEINTVMPTHVLFSVFQVGDEIFDLEIFWSQPPAQATREMMENHIRAVVAADERLSGLAQVSLHHHAPSNGGAELVLDQRSVVLETKALILDQPKIGGIVGIGVHASAVHDETLRLVMDSILSTMLNVVGSVKAIHKYTHDMEYYATRDPLTDLYNRRVFWELFEYEVARAKRGGYSFGLLVLDLDNFKLVNDNYGHALGDRYLQTFAHMVKQVLRPGDILARYGGDEFVALLPDVMPEMAAAVAQRILNAAAQMRVDVTDKNLGDTHISGSASIGLAVFPLHADNAKDLFLFADSMMYKAKGAGKNQISAPDAMEVAAVFRDMNETTLQVISAVNEGRIEPFFQPIVDLASGKLVGYEVLSRMMLADSHVEAARFIEFAEKAGVIHRLDTMIMEKALRAAAVHEFDGLIFINLSPRALALADFMHILNRLVAEYGIDPGRIVFEITERDTLKNLATLEHLVAELKLVGYKLAIDDFGSGFSSFQYLRRLPLDFLKIEGDFVVNMLENEKDRAFIMTIRQLAASLGIRVIAEHVESREVLEALREMGVELGQGYHIGRPAKTLVGGAAA
jgi:diguanylate cyclase (GGDEF)-like protein